MLLVFDDDVERSGDSAQFAGARIGNDRDEQFLSATSHCTPMLEREGPLAPLENAAHSLDRDIGGRTFDLGHGGQHLPATAPHEIAAELFLDRQAAEGWILGGTCQQ